LTVGSGKNLRRLTTCQAELHGAHEGEIGMTGKDHSEVAIGGSVVLGGVAVSLGSDVATDFTTDTARHLEGLLPEKDLRTKYELSDDEWSRLAGNEQLLRAVRAELDRRITNGEAAREAAQRHFAKAPSILNDIMQNDTISPRHRIEAAKELRQAAGGDRENMGAGEKFIIMIDLGEDHRLIKEFNQPARIPSGDGDAQ
jgi:hypothetical protein